MQMNWWPKALVFALLVVLATIAWTPYASAAIVLDSSLLRQTSQISSGGMSAPVCPTDSPSPCFDRDQPPLRDALLAHGGASAPPTTSSVTAGNAVAAVFAAIHVSPPQLVARFLAGPCLFFPEPPLRELLDVPRCARAGA